MATRSAERAVSLTLLFPAFCGMVAALALLLHRALPDPARAAGVFALLGLGSWAAGHLARRSGPAGIAFLVGASVALLFSVYSALSLVAAWFLPEDREWTLLHWDRVWFGYTWEGAWGGLAHPLVTDLLQAVYTSFYAFPLLLGVALARRRDWTGLFHGLDRVILGFLLSYCGYLLVPTRSPYAFVDYARELPTWGLQPLLHGYLVEQSWTKRDCFPSGHTMMSFYVAWLAWQRARPWAWVFVPWALLTVAATLYLRYHYLLDVLAGILACAAWAWAADRIWGPWKRRT